MRFLVCLLGRHHWLAGGWHHHPEDGYIWILRYCTSCNRQERAAETKEETTALFAGELHNRNHLNNRWETYTSDDMMEWSGVGGWHWKNNNNSNKEGVFYL